MEKLTGSTGGAVVLRWGSTVPGREDLLGAVLVEGMSYLHELANAGTIDSCQMYLAMDGDMSANGGFLLLPGQLDQLRGLQASTAWQRFLLAMTGVSEGVSVGLYGGGAGTSLRALADLHLDVQDQLGFFGRTPPAFRIASAD